jgi:hypothetical protein
MVTMRTPAHVVALLSLLVTTLSGCGTPAGTQPSEFAEKVSALDSDSPLCLQIFTTPALVGTDTYPTDAGRIRLRQGRVELVTTGEVRTLAGDAERLVDVREVNGITHVFYTRPVDSEEADLMAVTLTGNPWRISVGEAPEYAVVAVSHDPAYGHWVLTAMSDLTETIVIVDQEADVVRVLEPYPYNKGPLLMLAEPVEGGFFVVEGPEGVVTEWSVALLDTEGTLRVRLPLPASFGVPSGWVDRANDEAVVIGTDRAAVVVTVQDGAFQFSDCPTTPKDLITRRA